MGEEDLPRAELVPDEGTAGPEEVIEHQLLRDCIQQALSTLTPRERYVLQRRLDPEAALEGRRDVVLLDEPAPALRPD